jgi:aminopeptidase N
VFRTLATSLALAITLPLAGSAAAAPYDQALSTPVEDSYYPTKGDPGVDTLHYGLDLTWLRQRRVLTGMATIRFRATQTDDDFQLDLSDALDVKRVSVGGKRVTFAHVGKTLRVHSGVVADPDRRYTVRIDRKSVV